MNKNLKKIIIIVVCCVLGAGLVVGGFFVGKSLSHKAVNVYDSTSMIMTDYWADSTEISGYVSMDKYQKVYCSQTQTVTAVHVNEGDQVKAGDLLVEFDTTLSEIDLEKAEIEVNRLQVKLQKAKTELTEIENMSPYHEYLVTPDNSSIHYDPQQTPMTLYGKGTMEEPIYVLYDGDEISPEMVDSWFKMIYPDDKEPETSSASLNEEGEEESSEPETEPEPTPFVEREIYVAFITRYENALNGQITSAWGMRITKKATGLSYKYYDPVLSDEIQKCDIMQDPYWESGGSMYTSSEIAQMKNEKESEIKKTENDLKLAQVELKRIQTEVKESTVYSKYDGVVKSVGNPDEARVNGTTVVEVSAGGGYVITAYVGELENIKEGQQVTVSSWTNGTSGEGVVSSISEYPAEDGNYYSNGNSNSSYYPITVTVSAEYNLPVGSYVSVSYSGQDTTEDCFYLEKMFILSENGKNYVYVQGEDGKLKKKQLRTGKTIWGSYTQVFEGMEIGEWIAFPYGNDVFDGAKTNQADLSALYY